VSDPGQITRLMGIALVYAPAAWLIVGLAALVFGWAPRAAAAVAWVAVGYCTVVALFADSFNLPDWFGDASPFAHTPQAPSESVTAGPLIAIAALVILVLAGGFLGFRRRDVG
jgi:ABC-2 type transport system permease protein